MRAQRIWDQQNVRVLRSDETPAGRCALDHLREQAVAVAVLCRKAGPTAPR
jgi:hypothetical protein